MWNKGLIVEVVGGHESVIRDFKFNRCDFCGSRRSVAEFNSINASMIPDKFRMCKICLGKQTAPDIICEWEEWEYQ